MSPPSYPDKERWSCLKRKRWMDWLDIRSSMESFSRNTGGSSRNIMS